jgi:hypothetical protein
MRFGLGFTLSLLLFGAGCAVSSPPPPAQAIAATKPAPPVPAIADVTEIEVLRAALMHEVPQHTNRTDASDAAWIVRAKTATRGLTIDQPQLIVVVDRNPAAQELLIILAQPNGQWEAIGGSKVSTGQAGRRGYFITPTGIFQHTDDILDYRAQGTFNENHIRGLGLKGMRVWDFGWQTTETGWLPQPQPAEIRLLMHATDPDYLERRIGRPASEGCIRVPATMNRFLDYHGVLDADYERDAPDDPRLRALLLPVRQPTKLAGTALVVVDSSLQE